VSKPTLLLADDSVTIQKVVNLTFADEGIDVITVGDGDTAMQRISESLPDVVLADVHMPGLSGYRICEMLRENPATKDLPVVLLVGSFEPFDESEAARVGANAYLTKPFQSIRQLVTQVSALIESSRANNSEQAAVEQTPPQEPAETNDIDSLYQNSFTEREILGERETLPLERDAFGTEPDLIQAEIETIHAEPEPGPPRYVDAGMDDEMIQTTSVGESPGVLSQVDSDYTEVTHPVDQPGGTFESFAEDRTSGTAAATAAVMDTVQNFDPFAETESLVEADHSPNTAEFTLDEIELLELPPIVGGDPLEMTASGSRQADGAGKQVVNLSAEQLEIIVQKVVDKLSQKH